MTNQEMAACYDRRFQAACAILRYSADDNSPEQAALYAVLYADALLAALAETTVSPVNEELNKNIDINKLDTSSPFMQFERKEPKPRVAREWLIDANNKAYERTVANEIGNIIRYSGENPKHPLVRVREVLD